MSSTEGVFFQPIGLKRSCKRVLRFIETYIRETLSISLIYLVLVLTCGCYKDYPILTRKDKSRGFANLTTLSLNKSIQTVAIGF